MATAQQEELQMSYMLNFLGVAGRFLNPSTLGVCWNWCDSSTCELKNTHKKAPSRVRVAKVLVEGGAPSPSTNINTAATYQLLLPWGEGGIDPLMGAVTRLCHLI